MTLAPPSQVCIVGGGFGGLYTALYLSGSRLVRSGLCEIVLVEPKERFLFTPLLYELLTDELQAWEIAPTYEKLLRGKAITLCSQSVQGVDLAGRLVHLNDGQRLSYDYLVLAVGKQTRFASLPGIELALPFRTLEDCDRLNHKLRVLENSGQQRLRIAVVGGGPSGVELACKIKDRFGPRGEVKLIERGDKLLKAFSSALRQASVRALSRRRIEICYRTEIREIFGDGLELEQQGRSHYPADLVVWAAGTAIRDWVRELPCEHSEDGRVLVRSTFQVADYPEVLVLGDAAALASRHQTPATAQAAYQQASVAAKNLQALMAGKRLKSFRYLHLGDMLTLGVGDAVLDSFGITLTGRLAASLRRLIYVQRLPTWPHRLQVLRNLLLTWWRSCRGSDRTPKP